MLHISIKQEAKLFTYGFLYLSRFSTWSESGDPETWQLWPLPLHISSSGTTGTRSTTAASLTTGSLGRGWDTDGSWLHVCHVANTGCCELFMRYSEFNHTRSRGTSAALF